MRLVHYSRQPIPVVKAREQEPNPALGRFVRKPAGLWVSDEDHYGWKEWCENAEYDGCGPLAYSVTLKPQHKVLLVGGEIELEHFQARYSRLDADPPGLPQGLRGLTDRWIDWNQVAAEWHGVIITPYRWDLRLHHDYLWYYGWDCASGCIWNPEAIQTLTLEA